MYPEVKRKWKWLIYCLSWGRPCNPNKLYQWRRLIQTPACNFLTLTANSLSRRGLGSLRWILIVQEPKQILLPRRRSVINIVIWSHSLCSVALYAVPGFRSVCRQHWHVCLWVKVRWRGWQIPLILTWILSHIDILSSFLSPILSFLPSQCAPPSLSCSLSLSLHLPAPYPSSLRLYIPYWCSLHQPCGRRGRNLTNL